LPPALRYSGRSRTFYGSACRPCPEGRKDHVATA
jgi:hypothetical protein